MTRPDPMLRQRLRNHHRDLTVQLRAVEPGSRAHDALEAALGANDVLCQTLFGGSVKRKTPPIR